MKIKEMKEKGIEFVKENKVYLGIAAGLVGYGLIMWNFGDGHGYAKGSADTFKAYKDKINLGKWVGDMIPKGATFLADRYSNETTFNGAMNNMKEAVKLLCDPKNTEDVYGIMVLSKKNS